MTMPRMLERVNINPLGIRPDLRLDPNGAWGWGDNQYGQAGSGVAGTNHLRPVVAAMGRFKSLAGGGLHSLAVDENEKAWAWGSNSWGQLGDGSGGDQPTPVAVRNLTGVRYIAAGATHCLALCTTSPTAPTGTVWAWGLNGHGQLGDGSEKERLTPVQVYGMNKVIAIAACENQSLAITADNKVLAWGANDAGQLGDGTVSHHKSFPVLVKGPNGSGFLTGVTAIAAGASFCVAVADGKVWAWGDNLWGQLGDGSTYRRLFPVQVLFPAGRGPLEGVKRVAASVSHCLALRSDGTVYAWGANGNGTLGDGTTVQRNVAVPVGGSRPPPEGISAVAAGYSFSLALDGEGRVWSWGLGALGDNIGGLRQFPTLVVHPTSNTVLTGMKTIAAGRAHGLAAGTIAG
jgi:alpha-tubulin suppressor-like RCC1 family protein